MKLTRVWNPAVGNKFSEENTKTPHVTLDTESAVVGGLRGGPFDWESKNKHHHVVIVVVQHLLNSSYLAPTRASYSSSLMSLARPKSAILTMLLSPTRTFLAARSLWM